jgi:Domain of unknown function (DUF2019)
MDTMNTMAVDRYVAAALQHGECTRRGDSDAGNKAYARMIDALRELRAEPDGGKNALSELINNSDDWVKVWAATHLLPLSEGVACAALNRVASGPPSLAEFNAKIVLKQWRAGRLRLI